MGNWNTPADVKYTKNDEWVRLEGSTATIGLTDYAQEQLNDIVYVDLPGVGDKFAKGESFGVVESVKAASDVYTAVGGTVSAINDGLEAQPELINSDPYGAGWLVKLTVDDGDLSDLMDAAGYAAYCASR